MSRCVLAIETSTTRASLAVVKADEVVFEASFVSKRSHNSHLFGPLSEALEAAADDLGLIVVGLGPGSYTGVRIAIAAAQGVAFSKEVPLIGWSSLIASENIAVPSYRVVGDARRGRLYFAEVSEGELVAPPELVPFEEGQTRLREAARDAGALPWVTFDERPVLLQEQGVVETKPSAVCLAKRGGRATDTEIQRLALEVVEPLYLEGAFITKAKKRLF